MSVLAACLAGPALGTALGVQAQKPLAPEGFRVDLIAAAPDVLWPSAVHCLADGTLLVSEDRMDMPGPADQPIDKLFALDWKPDGGFEKRLVADGLYAVMGLAELPELPERPERGGAIYVMNMPHLTVLRDRDGDRRADERVELLTDLGPDAPGWPGGFNDHIVSGLRFGIDGWLYVSVGDKGIPLAHGTDGSAITLRGGGIVRLRPDGSRLEVVTRGTRNHLDVAIDERGEMFTYDNTDDGLGWWTRVTHHVPGGYYGYPWDYREHPERMLPCIRDFGGGSPCGALFMLGGAWPEPYAGSAYWCEWGKGIVHRFEFEPTGATFAIRAEEPFLRAGDVPDFRPLDACESPDGRFLYVADWGYSGWVAPAEAGRLWRVRRSDDDGPASGALAPSETRAAGSSERSAERSIESLLAELDDANFARRLAAQRALARAGAVDVLAGVIERSPSSRARRHAIWALAATSDAKKALPLRRALLSSDADTRAQAARALGDTGGPDDALPLLFLLDDADAGVRRWAAWALGRARTRAAGPRLVEALVASDDPFLASTLADSLRRLRSFDALVRALHDADAKQRAALWLALSGTHDLELVRTLVAARLPGEAALERFDFLATLWRKPTPWDGKWWLTQPAKLPRPELTVDWEGTDLVLTLLLGGLDAPEPEVRARALAALRPVAHPRVAARLRELLAVARDDEQRLALIDTLAAQRDPEAGPVLDELAARSESSSAVRAKAIEALATIAAPAMVESLVRLAGASSTEPGDVVRSLDALARIGPTEATRTAEVRNVLRTRMRSKDPAVRAATVRALVRLSGAGAEAELVACLSDAALEVRREAVSGLGTLGARGARGAIDALLAKLGDGELRDELVRALAAMPESRALPAFVAGLDSTEPGVRAAARNAIAELADDVRGELEALATRGKLSSTALAAVQRVYSEPRALHAWKLVGPFPKSAGDPGLEARELDLAAPVACEGRELAWIDVRGDGDLGFVDLERALAAESNVWAYATTTIESPIARETELSLGSDDQIRVWLNGERVHDFDGDRGFTADSDHVGVKLRAGSNRLLLRIGQSGGQWSFHAKVGALGEGPLFVGAALAPGLESYRAAALAPSTSGAVERGARLFRDSNRTLCLRCHSISGSGAGPGDGAGATVGPDLFDVGAKYARSELIDSLLAPSARVADAYRATSVVLKSERIVFGRVLAERDGTLELVDQNGDVQTLALDEVEERRESALSVMPDGLALLLEPAEFADLVAYLETLRGK